MKRSFLFCLIQLASVMLSAGADNLSQRPKALHHVVALKFKLGTGPDEIRRVEEAFRALKTKIPEISSLVWGLNNSPEQLNKGFTHCFILTFKSEKDRAVYLPHPEHNAFGAILGPVMADVLVIDFWSSE